MLKKIIYLTAIALIVVVPFIALIKSAFISDSCGMPENFQVKTVKAHSRGENSFTQGLFIYDGLVYESFGQYGESGRKAYKLGELTNKWFANSAVDVFEEGMTILEDEIVQISWKKGRAARLNKDLTKVGEFSYTGEGWGLTSNSSEFIMSDGSASISFRSPKDFKVKRKIEVKNGEIAQDQLNELEYINGEIWANIWQSDKIISINPENGCVNKVIDASSLWEFEDVSKKRFGGVLNGIAYDDDLGHIYLTGKYWKHIFQVELQAIK